MAGHDDDITSAVFSPSGNHILTASRDNTARLWGLTGKELAMLRHEGRLSWVWSAVFSPSGDRILTASRDATARDGKASDDAEAGWAPAPHAPTAANHGGRRRTP